MPEPETLSIEQQYELARKMVRRYQLQYADAEDVVQLAIIQCWRSGFNIDVKFLSRKLRHAFIDWKRWHNARIKPVSLNWQYAVGEMRNGYYWQILDMSIPSAAFTPEEAHELQDTLEEATERWPLQFPQVLRDGPLPSSHPYYVWWKNHRRDLSKMFSPIARGYEERMSA